MAMVHASGNAAYQYIFQKPRVARQDAADGIAAQDSAPLTEQEVAFAQARALEMKRDEVFAKLFGKQFESEAEEAALQRQLQEETAKIKGNAHLFTSEYKKARILGYIDIADIKGSEPPSLRLPRGGYGVNTAHNTMKIGIGSKVSVDGYNLWVFERGVGAFERGDGPPSDLDVLFSSGMESPYAAALYRLLGAVSEGGATWADDPELNRLTLEFLRKQGINTNRDFTINDTVFELKNGVLQTKGYQKPQTPVALGIAGLDELVRRAYEQNLLLYV